jgi:hypothetical protein
MAAIFNAQTSACPGGAKYRPTASQTVAMEPNLTKDTTPASAFTLPGTDQSFCVKIRRRAPRAAAAPNGGSVRGLHPYFGRSE